MVFFTVQSVFVLLLVKTHIIRASSTSRSPLQCAVGWSTSSNNNSPQVKKIPKAWINDGYCDCPLDGLDEPDTDACSGSVDGGWAGIIQVSTTNNNNDIGDDDKVMSTPKTISCEHQPDLILPLSRINDGICDCCNGSDESFTDCPDECDSILAEQRAQKEALEKNFQEGYTLLQEKIIEYEISREENSKQRTEVETRIPLLQKDFDEKQGDYQTALTSFAEERRSFFKNGFDSSTMGEFSEEITRLLKSLEVEKITQLIVGICQWEAEFSVISDDDNNGDFSEKGDASGVCSSLINAGYELGLIWDQNSPSNPFSFISLNSSPRKDDSYYAQILNFISDDILELESSNGDKKKKKKKYNRGSSSRRDNKKKKRKMTEEELYEYYNNHGDEDELEDEYFIDPKKAESSDDIISEEEFDVLDLVLPRSHIKKQISLILEETSKLLGSDEDYNDQENEEEEEDFFDSIESDNEENENDNSSNDIDPINLQKAHGNLTIILDSIKYGAAATMFAQEYVDDLLESSSDPYQNTPPDGLILSLASALIYHSNISSESLVDLFYTISVEQEDKYDNGDKAEECVAMLDSCQLAKEDGPLQISSTELLQRFEEYCQKRSDGNQQYLPSTCTSRTSSSPPTIPTNVPFDGFLGVYSFTTRSDQDPLISSYFQPLISLEEKTKPDISTKLSETSGTQEKLDEQKKQLSDLENEFSNSDKKYGSNGELYSLSNECFTAEVAKYEYEMCFHGKAHQRDIGAKKGGTHLGNWKGYSKDSETGEYLLKYDQVSPPFQRFNLLFEFFIHDSQ